MSATTQSKSGSRARITKTFKARSATEALLAAELKKVRGKQYGAMARLINECIIQHLGPRYPRIIKQFTIVQ